MTGIAMAHLTPNQAGSNTPTVGVVCPNCYHQLHQFQMFGPSLLPDATRRRGYMGHCTDCRTDCEVEQFSFAGVWPMSGWRLNGGPWRLLQLPVPDEMRQGPPVVTGPGGDFQAGYTPTTMDALEKIETTLSALKQVVTALINYESNR